MWQLEKKKTKTKNNTHCVYECDVNTLFTV